MMQGKWFHRLAMVVSWSLLAFGSAPVVAAKPSKDTAKPVQDAAKPSEEETKPKTFLEEMQAASPADRRKFKLVLRMQLHKLMYPGLEDLDRAMKMFQKDLGAEPTGEITEEQLKELSRRVNKQNIPDIHFPTDFSFTPIERMQKNGFATVSGTAVILDSEERMGFPINKVHISCYKDEKYCEMRETYFGIIGGGDELTGDRTWTFFERDTIFKLISWTDDAIEAVESDSSGSRIGSLSLNFKAKEFFWITKNTGNKDDGSRTGVKFEPLKKPRVAQLVNGDKIVFEYFKELKKEAHSFLSSDFLKQVGEMAAEK
jgi:hypothetical protein